MAKEKSYNTFVDGAIQAGVLREVELSELPRAAGEAVLPGEWPAITWQRIEHAKGRRFFTSVSDIGAAAISAQDAEASKPEQRSAAVSEIAIREVVTVR